MSQPIAVLISLIRSDSELLALLGERVRTGYAGEVDKRPYVLLWDVYGESNQSLDGETDTDTATIQLDVYADSFGGESGANWIAARIRDVLAANPRGNFAETHVSSIIRSGGPRQFAERVGNGSDDRIARVSIDYRIHYRINRT